MMPPDTFRRLSSVSSLVVTFLCLPSLGLVSLDLLPFFMVFSLLTFKNLENGLLFQTIVENTRGCVMSVTLVEILGSHA